MSVSKSMSTQPGNSCAVDMIRCCGWPIAFIGDSSLTTTYKATHRYSLSTAIKAPAPSERDTPRGSHWTNVSTLWVGVVTREYLLQLVPVRAPSRRQSHACVGERGGKQNNVVKQNNYIMHCGTFYVCNIIKQPFWGGNSPIARLAPYS